MGSLAGAMLLTGALAQGQAGDADVWVGKRGAVRIDASPSWTRLEARDAADGNAEVRIVVDRGEEPPRVGDGCALASASGDTHVVTCPAGPWEIDGSDEGDHVHLDTTRPASVKLLGGDDILRSASPQGVGLASGLGDDKIVVGVGDPDAYPRLHRPIIDTGLGEDVVRAGTKPITVIAGPDDDVVYGGPEGDIVFASFGDDRVYGGAGTDVIGGGRGDDLLDGGTGPGKVRGGPGYDRCRARGVSRWQGCEETRRIR